MSNFTSFILASIISILFLWGLYFLIKKWPKFHINAFGKVLKIVYVLALLLALTISFLWAYTSFENYWEDDRLIVITELRGFKLGWSKDEVYFREGEPTSVEDLNEKLKKLSYGNTQVVLENDKVVKIFYLCPENSYSYDKNGGISCDDDVDSVTKKYGKPENLSISNDKLRRLYSYPKYNLAYGLTKSKVEALAVFDSTYAPKGFAFGDFAKVSKSFDPDTAKIIEFEGKSYSVPNDATDEEITNIVDGKATNAPLKTPQSSKFNLATSKPVYPDDNKSDVAPLALIVKLSDGRQLEFPYGTDPSVVQSTVTRILSNSQASSEPMKTHVD